ncbi:MAG: TonB-dependent receptor [Bacteroidota bacterium]
MDLSKYPIILSCCLFLFTSTILSAQASLSGQVFNTEGIPQEGVEILLTPVDAPRLLHQELIFTDGEGRFLITDLPLGPVRLYSRHPDFISTDRLVELRADGPRSEGIPAEVQIILTPLSYNLTAVEVNSERDRQYDLLRLRAVEGTAIYAGKKTEVVDLSRLTINRAANNPRQVYGTVAGLNIYESDDAGLQLSIGGRGLDPNRTASFNVRQNGYDISADVLGYPESYYSPPAEGIERIQVVRGAASLQYGTQFGGLLNFVLPSPDPNRRIGARLRQTVGSYGLLNTFASFTGTSGKLGYYGHANYKRGDGFRPNSEYESKHVYLRLDWATGRNSRLVGELTWLDYLAQQAGGLTDAEFERGINFSNRSRNWFAVDWQLYALRFESQLAATTDLTVQLSVLNASRKAVGFRTNRVSQVDDVTAPRDLLIGEFANLSLETRLLHRYELGTRPAVLLVGAKVYRANNQALQGPGTNGAGADFSLATSEFPAYPNQSAFDFPNFNLAFFAEHIFYLSEKTSLTPGLRLEVIDTRSEGSFRRIDFDLVGNPIRDETFADNREFQRSFLLAGIGLSHRLSPEVELYANASQNYRSVTFNDIRIVNPSFQVDPDIDDERGYTLDLGLRGKQGRLAFDLTAYTLRYQQRLGEVLRPETRINAEGEEVETGRIVRFRGNIGDALIYGMESLTQYDFIPQSDSSQFRLQAFVNLAYANSTYLESAIAGVEGREVEFIPRWNLRTGLRFGYRNLLGSIQYSFLSEQFTDASNAPRNPLDNVSGIVGSIPAYGVLDFSLSYRLGRFQLEGGINNLLDRQYFTRRATGYPGPGIIPALPQTWYLGVEIQLAQ